MRKIKLRSTYKGTRIILGNSKRAFINRCVEILKIKGFEEIQLPIIQYKNIFDNKVGVENQNMMFDVKDKTDRELVLAPEYTAIIQQLAQTEFKYKRDVRLFYIVECFRGEKPQKGRYRQFTQLGVEILNPSINWNEYLINLASTLLDDVEHIVSTDVTRGLDYYKNGKGFELSCEQLGAQKQICGGGEYEGGIGFAIGVDRILDYYNK